MGWFYALAPAWLRRILARALGSVLRSLGLRSAVVRQNLLYAYPGNDQETRAYRDRVYRESYESLGALILEGCMVFGPRNALPFYLKQDCELRGFEIWQKTHALGRGTIFLSSHLGNWEIMAAAGAAKGISILIVTKKLKPEWFHQAVEQGRASYGVSATYEPKTLAAVMKQLRLGRAVGFVLDQYAGAPTGIRVPLFGIPVGTAGVVATLVRRTKIPVLPVMNYRLPSGRSVIEIGEPLSWIEASKEVGAEDRQNVELGLNTAHYVSVLESHIRLHPSQWLWIHRRFKGDLSPLHSQEWASGRVKPVSSGTS